MSKYTFTSNFVPDQLDRCNRAIKITHEFEADTIEEVCAQFEDFLRGAGFHFDGHLDIVEDCPVDKDLEDNKGWTDFHTITPLSGAETKDIPVPANLEVKGKFYVDPPSGWKYGFPRPYNFETDGPLREFFIKNGYPEKDATWAANNCRVFGEEAYNEQSS